MTSKETTSIALKCFALYLICEVLVALPTIAGTAYMFPQYREEGRPILWLILIPVVTIIFAAIASFLVWKTANSLAQKKPQPTPGVNTFNSDEVIRTVIICLGLYFLLHGLIELPPTIRNYQLLTKHGVDPYAEREALYILKPALQVIVGTLLLATPKQWLKAIRQIGRK